MPQGDLQWDGWNLVFTRACGVQQRQGVAGLRAMHGADALLSWLAFRVCCCLRRPAACLHAGRQCRRRHKGVWQGEVSKQGMQEWQ